MQELQNLMNEIAHKYKFDSTSYPSLKGKTPDEIFAFAVRHSALHMGKALGKVSTVSEAMDHGDEGSVELLEEGTVKMFINVLRLAELQGMSAERLVALVPKMMK